MGRARTPIQSRGLRSAHTIRRVAVLAIVGLAAACGAAGTGSDLQFDGERSFADLRALVALGPRPAGSEAAQRTRALITGRLRQAGWPVREHAFTA
jgi:hypothetical protein